MVLPQRDPSEPQVLFFRGGNAIFPLFLGAETFPVILATWKNSDIATFWTTSGAQKRCDTTKVVQLQLLLTTGQVLVSYILEF